MPASSPYLGVVFRLGTLQSLDDFQDSTRRRNRSKDTWMELIHPNFVSPARCYTVRVTSMPSPGTFAINRFLATDRRRNNCCAAPPLGTLLKQSTVRRLCLGQCSNHKAFGLVANLRTHLLQLLDVHGLLFNPAKQGYPF